MQESSARFAYRQAALSWFNRHEYRGSINQTAVVHHLPDPRRVANVCERIGIENDQISPLPHLYCSQILVRAGNARGLINLHRSHTASFTRFQLMGAVRLFGSQTINGKTHSYSGVDHTRII
jgi:hypothetical protein